MTYFILLYTDRSLSTITCEVFHAVTCRGLEVDMKRSMPVYVDEVPVDAESSRWMIPKA